MLGNILIGACFKVIECTLLEYISFKLLQVTILVCTFIAENAKENKYLLLKVHL